jgi:uncharacterized protein YcbK (DUF882 family)
MDTGATSEHFSKAELACHHCGVNECTPELVDALEALRALISADRGEDTPITVDDAYRCAVHNAQLAAAAVHSQHLLGQAADIRVRGMTAAELYEHARMIPAIQGFGRDDHKDYLHVDVRKVVLAGGPSKWCYTPTGATMPWYDPPAIAG